jgi:hypothetical protein
MITDRLKKFIENLDEDIAYDLLDCLKDEDTLDDLYILIDTAFPIYKNPYGN